MSNEKSKEQLQLDNFIRYLRKHPQIFHENQLHLLIKEEPKKEIKQEEKIKKLKPNLNKPKNKKIKNENSKAKPKPKAKAKAKEVKPRKPRIKKEKKIENENKEEEKKCDDSNPNQIVHSSLIGM